MQEPDLTVVQASENTASELGISPEDILGQSLDDILDAYQVDQFRVGLSQENLDLINPAKVWVRKKDHDYGVFDAIFHRSADGFLILELEIAQNGDNIPFLSFYHLAKVSISKLKATSNLRDLCQIIVREVRNVTDFERVMLYRFDQDGHGEVVAEDKTDEMESFMGLHYPESDIPTPARKMFLSNWIRVIPDASAEPIDLYPAINPTTNQPVDLTLSILRSAYSCHREYLHNMGVGASLTISLMKDDKLWGLIACHQRTPKSVPYELRKACEFLGRMIFAELSNREETEDHIYQMKLANIQTTLIDQMSESDSFVEGTDSV